MSWQALLKVKKIGTDEGPELFRRVFANQEQDERDAIGRKKRGPGFAGKKAVLLVLAEAHWPSKSLRISYAKIAETAGCSIPTVRRACKWLDEQGIVLHVPHHDAEGHRECNEFYINFDGLPRDVFAAQTVQIAKARRRTPTSQNDRKANEGLQVKLTAPTSQYEGDQYLSTVSSTERGQQLSLSDARQKMTLPPGWMLPEEDRQWTLANIRGATEELIAESAAVFWQKGHDTPQTPQERSRAWRIWARREREFKKNARHSNRTTSASCAIDPKIEIADLKRWLKRIGTWNPKVGPEPKSDADALARIEVLQFRSSAPSTPTSATEPRAAASCA